MHASTTEFSKNTLSHAKQLIKELDDAKFVYDRAGFLALLGSFTHAHKQEHEEETVAHLDEITTTLESLEHAYHDWLMEKNHQEFLGETKGLLGAFKEHTTAPDKPSWIGGLLFGGSHVSFSHKRLGFFSWIEVIAFWSVLLLGSWMVLFNDVHYLRYALILTSLCALGVLFLKWMGSLAGRVIVLALICSGVWARATVF